MPPRRADNSLNAFGSKESDDKTKRRNKTLRIRLLTTDTVGKITLGVNKNNRVRLGLGYFWRAE